MGFAPSTMQLTSTAFPPMGRIPKQYTGEGEKAHTRGTNSFGKQGYGGPLPPELHGVHHYYFWLLALRADAPLAAGLSMQDLFAAIEPHVIGMNRLIGTYSRPT